MHAVVRNYSGAGAKQLFDLLEERKADVEAVIRKVPGLVSYTMLRSGDGARREHERKAEADEPVQHGATSGRNRETRVRGSWWW